MGAKGIRNLLWGCGAALALSGASVVASASATTEYRAKAGFIFNFISFTTWPKELGSPLSLCVMGKNPFRGELDVLGGKTVGGRALEIKGVVTLSEIKGCQVVFVARSALEMLPRVVEALQGTPYLLITDSKGALDVGSGINMDLRDGKIVFQVSLPATRSSQVSLSAKLLRLASEVRQ